MLTALCLCLRGLSISWIPDVGIKSGLSKMGKGYEQTLYKRRHTWGQKRIKKCLSSLVIREMQIKTTLRYHLTPVRMAIIKKSGDNRCWHGCSEQGHFYCWWECKLVQPLWKTVWRFLKELNVELSFDPAIPLLGTYPEEKKSLFKKRYLHMHVYSSAIYNCKIMEPTQMPINQWVDKETVRDIYMWWNTTQP